MSRDFAFMHGGGQGSWIWAQTISAMALQSGNRYGRSLALDAPGCGAKRARDTSGITFPDIVEELVADIENAGMKDVVLVGHSQAGSVMPAMAELRPGLFRRLIYVSCSSPAPGVTIPQLIGNSLHGENENEVGWPIDPATTSREDRYRAMFCNDMESDEAGRFLDALGPDSWPMSSYQFTDWRYDHLRSVPTTYVVFLQDQALPVTWQERFAKRYHAGRITRIDAGHQGMMTRPHALAEVLLIESGIG